MANKVTKTKPVARAKSATAEKKHGFLGTIAMRIAPLTKNLWVLISVLVLLCGSQVAMSVNPTVGVYTNAAAFALLVGLALWQEKARQLAISAAILPVVTMVSLSLPQRNLFAQTVVFYSAILLLALVYRFMFTLDYPLTKSRLGIKGYARALPFMIVAGEILGVIGFGMLRHHYAFSDISLQLIIAASVVMAITEETYFRGLIQQRGTLVFHPAMAAVLSTLIYAATSIDHSTELALWFALLSGAVLSATYYKKQNLVLTMTINVLMKVTYLGLLATYVLH